jgi:hypothetical protein
MIGDRPLIDGFAGSGAHGGVVVRFGRAVGVDDAVTEMT